MAEIGLFDTIYNQRQITRYRRDPVSKEDIDKIIEAATKAPSGGNTQPWHFIAITDPDLIAKVGGLYRDLWLGGRGKHPAPQRAASLHCGTLLSQSHAGSAGYDSGLRRPLRGLYGPAPRRTAGTWPLRLIRLACGAEPVPRGSSPRTRYPHHYHPYPGRGKNQGVAGHPGPHRNSLPNAVGIPKRPFRPHQPEARRGGYFLQPVRQQGLEEVLTVRQQGLKEVPKLRSPWREGSG